MLRSDWKCDRASQEGESVMYKVAVVVTTTITGEYYSADELPVPYRGLSPEELADSITADLSRGEITPNQVAWALSEYGDVEVKTEGTVTIDTVPAAVEEVPTGALDTPMDVAVTEAAFTE
jgi:hypothetical protein